MVSVRDQLSDAKKLIEAALLESGHYDQAFSILTEQRREAARARKAAEEERSAALQENRNLYAEAVKEWVCRRDSAAKDRGEITDIQFGVGEGWGGTDVTAGDPDYAAITYKLRGAEVVMAIDHVLPVQIVQECLAILAEWQREESE
jgi:hypothetical protein